MNNRKHFLIIVPWAIASLLLLTNTAMAYVGPGAGMEFITYAMSLLAMIGVAFLSVIMWPIYTFIRWVRGVRTSPQADRPLTASTGGDNTPAAGALESSAPPAPGSTSSRAS